MPRSSLIFFDGAGAWWLTWRQAGFVLEPLLRQTRPGPNKVRSGRLRSSRSWVSLPLKSQRRRTRVVGTQGACPVVGRGRSAYGVRRTRRRDDFFWYRTRARRGPHPRAIPTVWSPFNNMVWSPGARRACGGHSGPGEDDQRATILHPLLVPRRAGRKNGSPFSLFSNMARRVSFSRRRSQVAGKGKQGKERAKQDQIGGVAQESSKGVACMGRKTRGRTKDKPRNKDRTTETPWLFDLTRAGHRHAVSAYLHIIICFSIAQGRCIYSLFKITFGCFVCVYMVKERGE